MNAEFGGKSFKASDIIRIIEAGTTVLGMPADASAKERADRLLDAFSEMLGRRLDRSTAGTIGKLLKNRLVDRPTFIDDSKVAATLKPSWEDHTSLYRIQVLTTKIGNSNTNHPAAAEAMSRISRISPTSVKANGQKGHAGGTGDTSSNPPHGSGVEADDLPDVPAGEEVVVS